MKRLFLLIVILCVSGNALNSQSLMYDSMIDFGDVEAGKGSKTLVFGISNNSTNPIEIYDIGSDCDCIKTDVSTLRIEPGTAASLKVTFNPDGMEGNVNRALRYFTKSNPKYPELVAVKAVVRMPVEVTPLKNYTTLLAGRINILEFDVVNRDDEDVYFRDLSVLPEGLADYDKEKFKLAPGEKKRIAVSIIPANIKSFVFVLKLKTTNEYSREVVLSFPVRPIE